MIPRPFRGGVFLGAKRNMNKIANSKHNSLFKRAFTLMEMIVVVLIVAILSAVALSIYMMSLEESRMAEAEMWLGTVILSQQRHRMSTGGNYARYWTRLDIAKMGQEKAKFAQTSTYCTQDTAQPTDGNCVKSGYKVTLYGKTSADSGVVAQRVNSGKYSYKLAQFYDSNNKRIYCVKGDLYPEKDKHICAIFLGLDEYDGSGEEEVARIEASNPTNDGFVWQ